MLFLLVCQAAVVELGQVNVAFGLVFLDLPALRNKAGVFGGDGRNDAQQLFCIAVDEGCEAGCEVVLIRRGIGVDDLQLVVGEALVVIEDFLDCLHAQGPNPSGLIFGSWLFGCER